MIGHVTVDGPVGPANPVALDSVRGRSRDRRFRAILLVVAVCGVLCTLALTTMLISAPGVYYSSARVQFVIPQSRDNPNVLQVPLRSLAMTAGVVAKMVDPARSARVSQPEQPLPDLGVRDGWSVQQPDRGGQWSHNFSDAFVTVQAVGRNPDVVIARMKQLETEVVAALRQLQVQADVDPVNYIQATLSPESIPLYYMGGSKPRALVGTMGLGLGLTAMLVTVVGRQLVSAQDGRVRTARRHGARHGRLTKD